ncbi:hypothetical protein MMC34_007629, partial [Xylographa carneopallida]|nr:hypothetical protein [Xylographa carneopallida]
MAGSSGQRGAGTDWSRTPAATPNSRRRIRDAEAVDPPLALLQSHHDRIGPAETKTTRMQFMWNSILQASALVIGIIFGVFSILSYLASETANSQSLAANQLALLALCLSSPNS